MKRLLSLFLCAVLTVSVVSIGFTASASDVSYDINPLFAEDYDAKTLFRTNPPYALRASGEAESAEVYTDFKAAAMFVRDCMLKRIASVTIMVSNSCKDNLTDVYKVNAESPYYPVYGAISFYVANGSTDGDYLACSYAGASVMRWVRDTYTKYTYSIKYRTTAEQEKTVKSFVTSFTKSLKAKKLTRLQQIHAIHDKICDTTVYDWGNYNLGNTGAGTVINTAYSAITDGKTMCEGYSMLFYYMCREMDIPVRIVHSDDHAWNIVKPEIGKYYYNVDVTWDDSYEFPDEVNPYGCDYYLKCDADMQHRISHRGYNESDNTSHVRIAYHNSEYFNKHFPISPTSYYLNNNGVAVCPYCESEVSYGVPTVNDHRYVKKVEKPTCTANGKTVYTCADCGTHFSEPLGALGHSFTKYEKYCQNGCKTLNKKYTVKPVAVSKLTAKKKALKIKWKQGTGKGYQLQVSTSKKFTKATTKTVSITNKKTLTKTVKKLKAKKKYYVRVRSYDKVGSKKLYSKWSKTKSIKTK